jgi:hypothetical protein
MTQDERDLLLQDLCARLPYKVMAQYYDPEDECETWDEIEGIESSGHVEIGQYVLPIENVKPFLFPLSSMTEEQSKELEEIDPEFYSLICGNGDIYVSMDVRGYDWLNKNHFDYRGLIPNGSAIDATDLNIY